MVQQLKKIGKTIDDVNTYIKEFNYIEEQIDLWEDVLVIYEHNKQTVDMVNAQQRINELSVKRQQIADHVKEYYTSEMKVEE